MIRDARREREEGVQGWRLWLVVGALSLAGVALVARALYLQVINQAFFEEQGAARIVRTAKLSANRAMILDRNGEPLAVSTPVDTVWADPRKLYQSSQDFPRLSRALCSGLWNGPSCTWTWTPSTRRWSSAMIPPCAGGR